MSVVLRMARAGTKKRPVYHIVVADSRSPRDGRFIERLGHYNPLMPKDNADRLKFDIEKAKAWIAKGAQPSDRIKRFLDAAGVLKRETRNNPEKAMPRKERKAARGRSRQGRGRRLPPSRRANRSVAARPDRGRETTSLRGANRRRARLARAKCGCAPSPRTRRLSRPTARCETEDGARDSKSKSLRPAKDDFVVRFHGVADRDAAEALRNVNLYVERDKLPKPEDGEFYHADLIGLAAVSTAGEALGEVIAVQNFGAGDIVEIRTADGSSTMLAFTEATVPEVDIAAGGSSWSMPAEIVAREAESRSLEAHDLARDRAHHLSRTCFRARSA